MGSGGQLNVSCSIGTCTTTSYTQQSSGTAVYADTPPQVNASGQALEYQYTVAALGCNGARTVPSSAPNDPYSAESNAVQYPGCSINPAIVENGAQNPSGTGDTPQDPWIFNSGDTITVTPAPLTNVKPVP